jgi:hypothetical protein
MEISHQRKERFYLKLLFGALIGIVLLIGAIWGGRDLYAHWQEKRLVRRAVGAMQRGDDVAASLAARTALEIQPSSAGAARVMAEISERLDNRAALGWRRKVVAAEPNSIDDVLAWARCALQFGDISIAEKALAGVNEEGKQRAGYHAVNALLAQARKEDDKAEAEWAQAVQLDPNEKSYQLKLGILRVRAKEEDRHATGKTMLVALRDDPKQRLAATRALIDAGIARHESNQELIGLARDLQGYPEATMNDRLIYLDFLRQTGSSEFTGFLTELENKCAEKPGDLAALLEWMSKNKLNLLALDFVKTVPAEKQDTWPVPLAIADLYARIQDWKKLEAITKNANWREGEFLRHAYLARALRAQDKSAAAEREWGIATKDASAQGTNTLALIHIVEEWKWEKEAVELLWALTKNQEKQFDAIQTLYRHYAERNETDGLYRALVRWAELAPEDLNVQNNLAQIGLLLNANPEDSRRLAAEVYQKMPTNPAYAATYAYSLLTKGNVTGAMKVMSSLSPEQLRDPPVSAYYGLCLAAAKDEKARTFLEGGQQAMLLPEEKRLVDRALANLDFAERRR